MNRLQAVRDVRAVYDRVADDYADAFPSTEPEQPVDLAMIDLFVRLLGDTRGGGSSTSGSSVAESVGAGPVGPRDPGPGPQVLDAGCGAGRLLPYLANRSCDVTGVDLSSGMLARARRDHPQFATAVASLTHLPFADGSFDGVLSWYSTIHLSDTDLRLALAEAGRVLRPTGLLLLAFQGGDGVRDIAQGMRDLGHDVVLQRAHRSADSVEKALDQNGFRVRARLERDPVAPERDPQVVLLAARVGASNAPIADAETRRPHR